MLIHLFAGIILLLGFWGIIFPILPGVPVMYAGLWIEKLGNHPPELTSKVMIVFGILTLISLLGDQLGRFVGAKKGGASRAGQIGAFIGLVLGIIFSPLGGLSIILLPPIGVIIGELITGRSTADAKQAAYWSLIGTLGSMLLNLLIATTMLVWWLRVIA